MVSITRADATALINQQNFSELWQEVPQFSSAMRTFRHVNMNSTTAKLALLDVFPAAPGGGAWMSGDTANKPTLEMAWVNKTITAEEIAGIVPVPENVLDDAAFDLWGEIRPRIAEYIGVAIDSAVFSGTNKPTSFPTGGLIGLASGAGNTTSLTTFDGTTPAKDRGSAYNDLIGKVEDDGFDPTVVWTKRSERRLLRNLRNTNGDLIYSDGLKGTELSPSIWGVPIDYVRTGGLGSTVALVGDSSKAILGIRQDVQFKFLDQATLTSSVTVRDQAGTGTTTVQQVAFSLAEQDMVALRFKVRVGFVVADPTTLEGGTSAFPFAVFV
jgi:HK97 family phage major capsid protein